MLVSEETPLDYATAILRGTGTCLNNIFQTIIHPIDNILYPMAEIHFHASTIHAAHMPDLTHLDVMDEQSLSIQNLQRYIKANPNAYHDATTYFNNMDAGVKQLVHKFVDGSGPGRTEMLVAGLGEIFVPGLLFKGVAATIKSSTNLAKFGSIHEPPLFKNNPLDGDRYYPLTSKLPEVSLNDIRLINEPTELLWTIDQHYKMRFSHETFKGPLRDVFGEDLDFVSHCQLLSGHPARGAGMVTVEKGLLKGITSHSGHYRPWGEHLKDFVEKAFEKHGFSEAPGKYIVGADYAKRPNFDIIRDEFNFKPGKETFATAAFTMARHKKESSQFTSKSLGVTMKQTSIGFDPYTDQSKSLTDVDKGAKVIATSTAMLIDVLSYPVIGKVTIVDILKYSLPLGRGVKNSVVNYGENLSDPTKEYAGKSSIFRDAVIIYMAHEKHNNLAVPDDYLSLSNSALLNQPIYLEALARMELVVDDFIKKYGPLLSKDGDGAYKAEILGEIGGDLLLPSAKLIWKHASAHHLFQQVDDAHSKSNSLADADAGVSLGDPNQLVPGEKVALNTDDVSSQMRAIQEQSNSGLYFSHIQMNSELNYQSINTFIESHYEPLFKPKHAQGYNEQHALFSQDITQAMQQTNWYSSSAAHQPLEQLKSQLGFLDYVTKYHGYFLTPEAKAQVIGAQHSLQENLRRNTLRSGEIGQYVDLNHQLQDLQQHSDHLYTSNDDALIKSLNPKLQGILSHANTPEELTESYLDLSKHDQENMDSDADQRVLVYLKDHAEFIQGDLSLTGRVKLQATLETVQAWDNGGKLTMELGRLASTLGNHNLGKVLIVSGALAQGISAAIMFKAASGAAALGPAAGIIGAMAAVASTMLTDNSNEFSEAVFAQFALLRQEIFALRKEVFELKKFVADFRVELYERLDIYFGAMHSQLLYSEEVARNQHHQIAYQSELIRAGNNAILAHLKDDILYQIRSYYEGITDVNHLTQKEAEQYLQHLRHLLDKTQSPHESGAALCQANQQTNNMAILSDIEAMVTTPERHGSLPGYLACVYQNNNWLSKKTQVMNVRDWPELVELYLFLRKTRLANAYDPYYKELEMIKHQGMESVDFMRVLDRNLTTTINTLLTEVKDSIYATIALFEYPEVAHKLTRQYEIPPTINEMIKAMSSYPKSFFQIMRSTEYTIKNYNSFLILERAGFGTFEIKTPVCPTGKIHKELSSHTPGTSYAVAFRYSNANEVGLTGVVAAEDNGSGRYIGCWGMEFLQPNDSDDVTNARQYILNLRRNYSHAKIAALEKQLPLYRKKISENLINMKAILSAAGSPEFIMSAFPMMQFPDELETFIAPYRADLHHTNISKALPYAADRIALWHNYTTTLEAFITLVCELRANNTNLFKSRAVAAVSSSLVQLNRLQGDLLFRKNTTKVYESTQSGTHDVAIQQRFDDMSQQIQTQTQEIQGLKQQLQQLLDVLMPQKQQSSSLIPGANAFVIPEPASISLAMTTPKTIRHFGEFGTCHTLSNDQMLCILPETNRARLVQRLPFVFTPMNALTTDHYVCDTDGLYCKGEKTEFVEQQYSPESNLSPENTLLNTAIYGAASAALPEAIGDLFELYSQVSKKRTQEIKWVLNVSIMLLVMNMDDWGWLGLSMLASHLATNFFKKRGLSEANASLAGNAVGFFVNAKCNVPTQSNMVVTVARQIGFWAEKQVVQMLIERKNVFDCNTSV